MRPGFTLIDTLISIGIIAILVSSIYPLIALMIVRNRQAQYGTEAALLLQQTQESAYNVFLTNWNAYSTGRYTVTSVSSPQNAWQLQSLAAGATELVKNRYSRALIVSAWCRNTNDGTLQKPAQTDACVTEPSFTLTCNSGYVADTHSRVLTSIVKWDENKQTKCISNSLLISNL